MRSGAYREPLVEGLQDLDPELARLVAAGDVRLAIAGSIVGPVKVRRDLAAVCVRALEQVGERFPDACAYYVGGLSSGRFVPVLSAGVSYIATGDSAEGALARQKAVLDKTDCRTHAPGGLFFRT